MARMNIKSTKLMTGQSLSGSFTAGPIPIDYEYGTGIIVETSGVTTNTGVFKLQARIKVNKDPNMTSAWVDLGPSFTLNNADVANAFNVNTANFSELQLVFTPGGGTPNGTVTVWTEVKQVGA